MGYTYYNPLKVWLDPASIADVVSYMQTYLEENPIKDTEEINQIIAEYIAAHPEIIGGVQSVNGETGAVVLTASDINTTGTTTIQEVLTSLASQISDITQTVTQNTDDISDLKSATSDIVSSSDTGVFSIRDKIIGGWKVGTLQNGQFVSNSHRVCSVENIVFDRNVTILIATGRRCALQRYVNNEWIDDGWQTVSFTVTANTPFRIVISPTTTTGTEENTWTGNINQYTEWVTYNTTIKTDVDWLIEKTNDVYGAGKEIVEGNAYKNSTFNAVFFSDIHGSSADFSEIVDYSNTNKTKLNVVLNGGDTVIHTIDEDLDWYNTLVDECDLDVLACVGNHDYNSSTDENKKQRIYNSIIAPIVSRVQGIVQPENAATNGLCYYYKDYGSVRVVVLDAMYHETKFPDSYDETQRQWFQGVLSDAITKSLVVIGVVHAPYNRSNATLVDSVWTGIQGYGTSYDYLRIVNNAAVDVDTFINNGGKFACWLAGHLHRDNLMTDARHPGQIMIDIASARRDYHPEMYVGTDKRCFNVLSIDTDSSLIKMRRIGIDMDYGMKQRNYLCYDYQNMKIIAER